jgi:hypothetical protein
MSASEDPLAGWQDPRFLERLTSLEGRHQRIQSEHESVRRGLEGARRSESTDLRLAWRRYCEVIAELDQATAELEALRARSV